jgi:hypothetical protein
MSKKKSKIKVRQMEVVALGICNIIKTKKKTYIDVNDIATDEQYGAVPKKVVNKFLKKHKDLIIKVKASKCDEKSQDLFDDNKSLKFIELDAVAILGSKMMIKPKKVNLDKPEDHSVSIEIKGSDSVTATTKKGK